MDHDQNTTYRYTSLLNIESICEVWRKLTLFQDYNFNFDENGRKLSKWVENTVGKGEIARYEQFLLFPQCFQKTCTAVT